MSSRGRSSRSYIEKLAAVSPYYRKYYQLDELPEDTPNFTFNQNGYPKVYVGELHCRLRGENGRRLCGRQVARPGDFYDHIESGIYEHHGIARQKRTYGSGHATDENIKEASDFYESIMKSTYRQPYVEDTPDAEDPQGSRKRTATTQVLDLEDDEETIEKPATRQQRQKSSRGSGPSVSADQGRSGNAPTARSTARKRAKGSSTPPTDDGHQDEEEDDLEFELEEIRLKQLDIQAARTQRKLAAIKRRKTG